MVDPNLQLKAGETPEQYKARVASYQTQSSSLPSMQNTGSTPVLPSGVPSNLLSFKDTLSAVVNLAKQNRNQGAANLMSPLQGTVAASDFNSILGNMNQAGNTFTQDVLKSSLVDTKPTYKTEQIGDTLYQYQVDPTGKILGNPTVVMSNPSSTKNDKKNEENDVASAIIDFQNQIQKKGWAGANPDAYNYYKNELVKLYGASSALALDKAMADAGISVDYAK